MNIKEFRIRDPFVIFEEGTYYMTGTDFAPSSIYLYKSLDLNNWEKLQRPIYYCDNNNGEIENTIEFWAPEIHKYNNKYYLFFSPLYKSGRRGTQIAVSEKIEGPYSLIKDGPSTPEAQSCIDGTLYIENGEPYIIYSHDWPDNYIAEKEIYEGEICAAQLSKDLCEIVGEPFVLFKGSEPCFCKANVFVSDMFGEKSQIIRRFGTDAPFLYKTENDDLILLWSPMIVENYVVAMAKSKNGKIRGKWEHSKEFLYDRNGGHAAIFKYGKQLACSIHAPEKWFEEHLLCFPIEEKNGWLKKVNLSN